MTMTSMRCVGNFPGSLDCDLDAMRWDVWMDGVKEGERESTKIQEIAKDGKKRERWLGRRKISYLLCSPAADAPALSLIDGLIRPA